MIPSILSLSAQFAGFALILSSSASAAPQSSGPTVRWEIDDNQADWVGSSVAIGDHGSALISARVLFDSEIVIHSTASELPIGQLTIPNAPYSKVAAARASQALAALTTQEQQSGGQLDVLPTLRVWQTARAGLPDWEFSFPLVQYHASNGMGVQLSDDGERVVAWFSDRTANMVLIRVFDAFGGQLLSIDVPDPSGFGAWGSNGSITPDASRLLIDISSVPQLFDLSSGLLIGQWDQRDIRGGLALSADGHAVAIGDQNVVQVYRENPLGAFDLNHSFSLQGDRFGGPLALDSDASHLAYSVNWSSRSDKQQIRMRDLAAGVERWRQEIETPGNELNLWVARVMMSEDAAAVAVSSYGDDFGSAPTGFVFDQHGDALSVFKTEGSALDMDYDASAELIAFATKDTHINRFGNGGDIICADVRPIELAISGLPTVGSTLDVTLQGNGTHAQLAVSSELGNWATPYGVSQLDSASLLRVSPQIPLIGGVANLQFALPNSAAIIGLPLHSQAALSNSATGGGYLSNRVSVRVLP